MPYDIKSVCLFCASSSELPASFLEASQNLVSELKRRDIGHLVYGGGSWGLMGSTAKAAVAAGMRVTGVVPRFMLETAGEHHGETVVVESMAERKLKMAELSDCFICLPGGFGTVDELTEMLTWNQLGIQAKPVGLLNVDGFWDGWVGWVGHAVQMGLIKRVFVEYMVVEEDAARLLERMGEFEADPEAAKFFTKA